MGGKRGCCHEEEKSLGKMRFAVQFELPSQPRGICGR